MDSKLSVLLERDWGECDEEECWWLRYRGDGRPDEEDTGGGLKKYWCSSHRSAGL